MQCKKQQQQQKITKNTSGVHHSTVLTLVEVWNAVNNGLFCLKFLILHVLPCLVQKYLWFLGTCRCFEDDFKIKILNFMLWMGHLWNLTPWRVLGQGWTVQHKEAQIATCSWTIWFKHWILKKKQTKTTQKSPLFLREISAFLLEICSRGWSLLGWVTSGLALGDERFWRIPPPFFFLENHVGVVQGTGSEVTRNFKEQN